MNRKVFILILVFCLVGVLACRQRTDKSEGTVILSVSDFDGLPIRVSVNGTDIVQIGELEIQNIPKDPNGTVSDLMNVEMRSFEVTYTRADSGTRVPPPFTRGIFGVAPVGGTIEYENLPVMSVEQLRNPPLSDLLFINGGFDRETGSQLIVLNFQVRFFGKTLSGDEVQSEPFHFTVEFVP